MPTSGKAQFPPEADQPRAGVTRLASTSDASRGGERNTDNVEVHGSNPCTPTIKYSGVEQLAARQAHNLEVVGSNPTPATIKLYIAGVAQW